MAISDELIQEILKRVLSATRPDRVILFGSAARGRMTRDSDIDLLVLAPAPGDTREEGLRIREKLRGLGFGFDVIVMQTDEFEESKEVIGGLAYPANKHGRVIYEVA